MSATNWQPQGVIFFDNASKRQMLLVGEGEAYAGWLCYKHPDGHWVTLRKATEDDREKIAACETFGTNPLASKRTGYEIAEEALLKAIFPKQEKTE